MKIPNEILVSTTENSVLAAVIAGIFSVIGCLISLLASRKSVPTPSKRDIYLAQLNNVWEPLDRLLSFENPLDSALTLQTINAIVSSNYKLIPKEIINEVTTINQISELTQVHRGKLAAIVASYFHWTKRYLGYPYDRKKIKVEYSPRSRLDIFFTSLGYALLLLIALIGGFAIVLSFMLLVINERLSISDQFLLGITLISALSALWVVFFQPKK